MVKRTEKLSRAASKQKRHRPLRQPAKGYADLSRWLAANVNKIVTAGSLVWTALLGVIFLFMFPMFPFTIYTDGVCWGILAISLAFYVYFKKRKLDTVLGLIGLFLVIPIFLSRIFSPFIIIDNPFTPQQFASRFDINLLYKGTVTYYRKSGFILYAPQESEYGDITPDSSCVTVYRDKICVSSTFAGQEAAYQVENNHINLRGNRIDKFVLYKDGYKTGGFFEITEDTLYYQSSDDEVISRPLTDDEYKKLRTELESMELTPYILRAETKTDENLCNYKLSVDISNSDRGYYSYVDGQKLYEFMYTLASSP